MVGPADALRLVPSRERTVDFAACRLRVDRVNRACRERMYVREPASPAAKNRVEVVVQMYVVVSAPSQRTCNIHITERNRENNGTSMYYSSRKALQKGAQQQKETASIRDPSRNETSGPRPTGAYILAARTHFLRQWQQPACKRAPGVCRSLVLKPLSSLTILRSCRPRRRYYSGRYMYIHATEKPKELGTHFLLLRVEH